MLALDRQPHQEIAVQPTVRRRAKGTAKESEIRWNEWWPFTRATGKALKQLNKRQPKEIIEYEDAPL